MAYLRKKSDIRNKSQIVTKTRSIAQLYNFYYQSNKNKKR